MTYDPRVARRAQTRQYGPGPYLTGFRWTDDHSGVGFPFDVPAIAAIENVMFDRPVTLLAGENGSGKSTAIEAVAEAMGFASQGGELSRLGQLPAVVRPAFDGALKPILTSTKPRNGYFLRAESFFNLAQLIDSGDRFAPDISLYGGIPLHAQSHGQSFISVASERFGGDGLYVLDEPEAALSVTGALALLAVIVRAVTAGAQFIVATHSPVLLACPRAYIYEFSDHGVAQVAYDDLEEVRLTRSFLEAPERFLRVVLGDLE